MAPQGRKLLETSNFVDLYMHMVGKSEVPRAYHEWACLSLMAACVADRVWLEKFKGSKLAPNLYVILIGPSGDGKGVGISRALKFVKDLPIVNTYRGKSTGQYLIEHLGRQRKLPDGRRVIENAKLYLATPELSMSVGTGQIADDFIKIMTDLWEGGDEIPLQFGTRMYGNVVIRGQCINWIGGSTKQWFVDTLNLAAIKGGAVARMVLVVAQADPSVRYTEPVLPDDYDEVRDHLQARVLMLTSAEGMFEKSREAWEVEDRWYHDPARQPPDDDALVPTWKRQHDLVLKLAQLYCLADGRDLVIGRDHMTKAISMSYTAQRGLPEIVALAAMPPAHNHFMWVRDIIRKHGAIQRTTLGGRCSRRGITASKLDEYIRTLKSEGAITIARRPPRSALWYQWVGRRFAAESDAKGEEDNGSEEDES